MNRDLSECGRMILSEWSARYLEEESNYDPCLRRMVGLEFDLGMLVDGRYLALKITRLRKRMREVRLFVFFF